MSKKVLITSRSFGKISNEPLDILTGAGFEVTMKGKDFDQAEFEAMIPDYDALIIGAHEFPEAVMERCPKLKIICKHGEGQGIGDRRVQRPGDQLQCGGGPDLRSDAGGGPEHRQHQPLGP